MVEPQTYLYYMQIGSHVSRPSEEVWTPYTEEMEEIVLADFRRLWDTNFLDDLWIEVVDDPFENGVEGVRVIFNMEERQRVKIVGYSGSDELDRGDIETSCRRRGSRSARLVHRSSDGEPRRSGPPADVLRKGLPVCRGVA